MEQWYNVIEVPAHPKVHVRRGIHAFGISPDEYETIKNTGIPMGGARWDDGLKLFVYPIGAKHSPDIVAKARALGLPNQGTIYTRKGRFLR